MSRGMLAPDTLAALRQRIIDRRLTDTYRIYAKDRTNTGSGLWSPDTLTDPIEYNGSPDIPCRVLISRHYTREDIYDQEVIINEYEIHVPHDAPLRADHTVNIDNRYFEVIKLFDSETDRLTKWALLVEVMSGDEIFS